MSKRCRLESTKNTNNVSKAGSTTSSHENNDETDIAVRCLCIPPYADRFMSFGNDTVQQMFMKQLYQYTNTVKEVIIELSRFEANVDLNGLYHFMETCKQLSKVVLSGNCVVTNEEEQNRLQRLQLQQWLDDHTITNNNHQRQGFQNNVNRLITVRRNLSSVDNGSIESIDYDDDDNDDHFDEYETEEYHNNNNSLESSPIHLLLRSIASNTMVHIKEIRLYNVIVQASQLGMFLQQASVISSSSSFNDHDQSSSRQIGSLRRLWFHGCTIVSNYNDELLQVSNHLRNSTIQKLSFSTMDPLVVSLLLRNMESPTNHPLSCSSHHNYNDHNNTCKNSNNTIGFGLQELDLSNFKMDEISPCLYRILSSVYSPSQCIKSLTIYGSTFNHTSFQSLMDGIQENSTLERLFIMNAQFVVGLNDGNDCPINTPQLKSQYVHALCNSLTLQQINVHTTNNSFFCRESIHTNNIHIDDDINDDTKSCCNDDGSPTTDTQSNVCNDNKNSEESLSTFVGSGPFFDKHQRFLLDLCCVRNRTLQQFLLRPMSSTLNYNNTTTRTRKNNNGTKVPVIDECDRTSYHTNTTDNDNRFTIGPSLWPYIFSVAVQASPYTTVGSALTYQGLLLLMDDGIL